MSTLAYIYFGQWGWGRVLTAPRAPPVSLQVEVQFGSLRNIRRIMGAMSEGVWELPPHKMQLSTLILKYIFVFKEPNWVGNHFYESGFTPEHL